MRCCEEAHKRPTEALSCFGSDCGGSHWYSGDYCHNTFIDDGDCTGKEYCDYDVIDGRWECTRT